MPAKTKPELPNEKKIELITAMVKLVSEHDLDQLECEGILIRKSRHTHTSISHVGEVSISNSVDSRDADDDLLFYSADQQ